MGNKSHLGDERRKVHPKLRMIANGNDTVNLLRTEHSACLRATNLTQAKKLKGTLEERAFAPAPKKRFVRRKLTSFADNVRASVMVTLAEGQRAPTIPGETCRHGNIATAALPVSKLQDLAKHPSVLTIELGETLEHPRPIIATATIAPPSGARSIPTLANLHENGKKVLIGIIDVQGFDFAHPDFLDAAGKTRFVRVWDQGGKVRPSPSNKPPFDYGSEFTKAHLDAAIAAAPGLGVPAQEIERQSQIAQASHGTHVASIAAGNLGVCRQAGIAGVLIHLPQNDLDRRLSFYDSTRILHAVEYLIDVAQKGGYAAVAINISLGTNGHAHDGSSATSRWLDALLTIPGRAICVAAGNAGQEAAAEPGDWGYVMGRIHTSGHLSETGTSATIEWTVVGNGIEDISENELEIWYSPRDQIEVSIKPPGKPWIGPVGPGEFLENKQVPGHQSFVSTYNDPYHPANGDGRIAIYLSPLLSDQQVVGVQAGTWLVRLHGKHIRNGAFHGWIERDDPRPVGPNGPKEAWYFPSFFSSWSNVDSHSISSLGCGERVISVANMVTTPERINISSSQGPTRDGRTKPEVAAPGTDIVAARGFDPDALWVSMTGTSMASPFVTGVVGLMLSINPKLTAAQVLGILRRSARPVAGGGDAWQDDAGFGVIDPAKCLEEAKGTLTMKDLNP